jgi:hypothetical protein
MKRLLASLGVALFATGMGSVPATAAGDEPVRPVLLEKAEPLPLALSDDFEFRKVLVFNMDAEDETSNRFGGSKGSSWNESIGFERKYRRFGAITSHDRMQRNGKYFTFVWKTQQPSNVTVRFEYRQRKLGPYVQAQEISYENATGVNKTEFAITGDANRWDGPVTSWRALLIHEGKIVALHSSYLWN